MQLNEVRDDWRKKKSYYERLEKGPGTKTCMGMIAGIRCNKMIHTEIGKCGVAYVCRNGMCYKEEDVECDNWMCFDCKEGGNGVGEVDRMSVENVINVIPVNFRVFWRMAEVCYEIRNDVECNYL
jgi:hypothetical protein